MKNPTSPCPCTSGKSFNKCCGRFLEATHQQHAKTPEQLMRSRFTAFKLGGHGQYLIATWADTTCPTTNSSALDEKELDWQHLAILDSSVSGDTGIVEFKAFYKDSDGSLACLHERSSFIRQNGRWFYTQGVIY